MLVRSCRYRMDINVPDDEPRARKLAERLVETLLPCPFCGAEDLELVNTHTPSYWVECETCRAEAHGDSLQTHTAAIRSAVDAWNRRAT